MKNPDETREEYVERMDKEHRENWICLGEVEEEVFSKTFSCFECSDSPNNYLFINKDTEHYFCYSISPSYYQVGFINPTFVDKETTPLEFLKIQITDKYVWCNKNYPCDIKAFKIRLKEIKSWIFPKKSVPLCIK
jgi:hypothetical protein